MKIKRAVIIILILFFSSLCISNQKVTKIFFVRHAEKALNIKKDPPLNEKGIERANELAYIMQKIEFADFFSTPYKRTVDTLKPLADSKNKKIIRYNPGEMKVFLKRILKDYKGKTVIISGHSNTVPQMLNFLLNKQKFQAMDDSTYDNLFLVCAGSIGDIEVVNLKFGAHTPYPDK